MIAKQDDVINLRYDWTLVSVAIELLWNYVAFQNDFETKAIITSEYTSENFASLHKRNPLLLGKGQISLVYYLFGPLMPNVHHFPTDPS